MQLLLLGQNVCEVNRERSRLAAASSVCDSTKHNGLVTVRYRSMFGTLSGSQNSSSEDANT